MDLKRLRPGLLTSPWAAFVLALAFVRWLLAMKSVWGVEIDAVSLYPKWVGLLSYVMFFVVGWIIYRNIDKLPVGLSAAGDGSYHSPVC